MIKIEDIYAKTNKGLDIICYYYPQAREAIANNKHFKLRGESTASACCKLIKDIYRVTDFGDEGKAISPIDIAMKEEGRSFGEMIQILAERYGVESQWIKKTNKAIIRKAEAEAEEKAGDFSFESKQFSEFELKVLGPNVTKSVCEKYGYVSLKTYKRTSQDKASGKLYTTVIESTETFPIFMRICKHEKGEFYKIYQPLNPEKGFRFFYAGEKPADYINGLKELSEEYSKFNRANPDGEQERKLEAVMICSGERDALNCASMGYPVVWFNSETYDLQLYEYNKICMYAERIYNIPDIDNTGIRKGIDLGMKYLDIYTIWLPDKLKNFKDARGKSRKDLRDYMEIYSKKSDFENIVRVAMPFRFWESVPTKGGTRLEINTEFLLNFLFYSGYAIIKDKNAPDGYSFIHVDPNGIVKEATIVDIRTYVRTFAKSRFLPLSIQNLITNSTRISNTALKDLPCRDLDFKTHTHESQYLFFENEAWLIDSEGIKQMKGIDSEKYVWDEKVVKHKIKRTAKAFEIINENDGWDINILNQESKFFCYLINSSRMFWRKELEERAAKLKDGGAYIRDNKFNIAGKLLSEEEIAEQKQHLINKIFSIGYLLHKYKQASRAWAIFAMDNKIDESGESNGGSGKSFCYRSLRIFLKSDTISGKDPKISENKHVFERVTEHTDMIIIDDTHKYMDFEFFFDKITGDMPINVKNAKSYNLDYDKSPKMVFTSNYTVRNMDPSKARRLLYTSFSDYYHKATEENGYLESRTIHDDFGMDLQDSRYPEEDWNADINFYADCLQFYLSTLESNEKIDPPMNKIILRTLKADMGENFEEWASTFFSESSENLDCLIIRRVALNDFMCATGSRNWTTNKFSKALRAFAKISPVIESINPPEVRNKEGRVTKKVDGKTEEMIYLKSYGKDVAQQDRPSSQLKEDEKPF